MGVVPKPREHGRYAELVAASWLRSRGHRILRMNWIWGKRGEIDIVSRQGDELVFTEVKSALGYSGGGPAHRVDREKRERLRLGAHNWLRLLGREVPVRFDIAEVYLPAGQRPELHISERAFGFNEGRAW